MASSFSSSSNIAWDLHSFGVFKADMSLVMESPSDLSTGYLEDAIAEWSNHCKRRRMLSYSHNQNQMNCWSSNVHGDPFTNYSSCFTQSDNLIPADNPLCSLTSNIFGGSTSPIEMKTGEEPEQQLNLSSSSTTTFRMVDSMTKDPDEKDATVILSKSDYGIKKVAYPFNVVKPGGMEGDVTLDDINERMLMPPTRPVRHPVGDLACHKSCVSASGLGLSGKAVVAFTRIRTQGRGTVTIIRTRG